MSENAKDISTKEEKDLIKKMIHMVNPEDCRGNQRDPEYDRKRDSQKFNGELCDRIKKRSIVSR